MTWSHRSRAATAVDPEAVVALEGAGRLHVGAPGSARCTSSTSPSASTACMKASVTPMEMLKLVRSPLILGVDEILDVRVVAAQHAHLGAAAGAGGLHGFAGSVEDAHVETGPEARDWVPLTWAPWGRMDEVVAPTPPPRRMVSAAWARAV